MEQADPTSYRYVVLWHDGIPEPHFDLMLEEKPGSALMTFRCPAWPITEPVKLERLADHRRDYLDYEGPVSGGRGLVRRVEAGTYTVRSRRDDPDALDLRLDPGGVHLRLISPSQAQGWHIEPAAAVGEGEM